MKHARWQSRSADSREVYLVDFEPTLGAEIRKTRPAPILQNDIANEHSPIAIVAAITSKFDDRPYPPEVPLKALERGLNFDSVVLLNRIRSIDRRRLVMRMGKLRTDTMTRVDNALQISLGMVEL